METTTEQLRTCRKCGETKPVDGGFRTDAFRSVCRRCEVVRNLALRKSKRKSNRKPRTPIMECSVCNEPKPLAEFRKGRQCRACTAKYGKAYALKSLYGLTVEQYDALIGKQGGRCGICKGTNGGKALAVDHDHQTGAVRGALCDQCNLAIGSLGDTLAAVEAAAAYMRRAYGVPERRRLVYSLAEGLVNNADNN